MFRKLILVVAMFFTVPVMAQGLFEDHPSEATEESKLDRYGSAFGYFGASHIITELTLKTTHLFMRDYYGVSPYNRMFSSTLVGAIMWQQIYFGAETDGERATNAIGAVIGIVTGNLMQIEW